MRMPTDGEWLRRMAEAEDSGCVLVGSPPLFADQTVFEDGKGDCLRACVASVLGLQVEDLPNFAECGFFDGLVKWLDASGMRVIQVRFSDPEHLKSAWFDYSFTDPCIMWGDGPRFKADGRRKQHAVVGMAKGYGCEILHDPHPSRDGLHACYGVMWLVPKAVK